MPNEMNHAEVAEKLEEWAQENSEQAEIAYKRDTIEKYRANYNCLSQAAADERKIASGEYAPVVHTKWVYLGYIGDDEKWGCENCHNVFDKKSKYCPHCNALMDGKDDNHDYSAN